MCLSDEPGYYEEGNFGIRIENVDVVKVTGDEGKSLTWENMTMAPYCSKLIKKDLLTHVEIDHINKYHAEVYCKLKPLLSNCKISLEYLERECA